MNKKELLYKIIHDELTPEEEKKLMNHSSVVDRMHSDWDKAERMNTASTVNADKSLTKISDVIWRDSRSLRLLNYYKIYSVAASILLLFMLGSSVWFYQKASVQPGEVYVMTCGRQTVDSVVLPDGTRVLISSGSKLTYPKTFQGAERRVQLSGQAFFDVVKNKKKPFIVQTEQMEVTALGTAFEVFSFDQDVEGETVLLNGKVKIAMTGVPGTKQAEYILHPNQKLSVRKGEKVKIEKVDANAYSAWRSKGCLSFDNESLSMIIPRLERWYNKDIECDPQVAKMYRFSFTINDETCNDVLRMLSKTSPLVCEEIEGVYKIRKK
ncbi:MAG: FecR domain-containing protein [Bacteroides sp.]|uniref:FecR family protein n=1 Tax=Bacteroides sp. TaxID=29523 RepID=UPI002FCA2C70|nr:DUF4974 domain-containing protein [Bacteroides sp.]